MKILYYRHSSFSHEFSKLYYWCYVFNNNFLIKIFSNFRKQRGNCICTSVRRLVAKFQYIHTQVWRHYVYVVHKYTCFGSFFKRIHYTYTSRLLRSALEDVFKRTILYIIYENPLFSHTYIYIYIKPNTVHCMSHIPALQHI